MPKIQVSNKKTLLKTHFLQCGLAIFLFLLKKGQFTVNHLIKTILKQKFHINVRDSLQSNLKRCC